MFIVDAKRAKHDQTQKPIVISPEVSVDSDDEQLMIDESSDNLKIKQELNSSDNPPPNYITSPDSGNNNSSSENSPLRNTAITRNNRSTSVTDGVVLWFKIRNKI